jgi:hypothetical protein
MFENQTRDTEVAILAEIQRVAGQDPRIYIASANLYPQENGMLIEVLVQLVPNQTTELLSIFFNQETRRASYV